MRVLFSPRIHKCVEGSFIAALRRRLRDERLLLFMDRRTGYWAVGERRKQWINILEPLGQGMPRLGRETMDRIQRMKYPRWGPRAMVAKEESDNRDDLRILDDNNRLFQEDVSYFRRRLHV